MIYSKHFALFCILSFAGSAYASYFDLWDSDFDDLESDRSEPDVLDEDTHPVADFNLLGLWNAGNNLWNYWNKVVEPKLVIAELIDDVLEAEIQDAVPIEEEKEKPVESQKEQELEQEQPSEAPTEQKQEPARISQSSNEEPKHEKEQEEPEVELPEQEQLSESVNEPESREVYVDMAEIYKKMYKNSENGLEVLEAYEIPESHNYESGQSSDVEMDKIYETLHGNLENDELILEPYAIPVCHYSETAEIKSSNTFEDLHDIFEDGNTIAEAYEMLASQNFVSETAETGNIEPDNVDINNGNGQVILKSIETIPASQNIVTETAETAKIGPENVATNDTKPDNKIIILASRKRIPNRSVLTDPSKMNTIQMPDTPPTPMNVKMKHESSEYQNYTSNTERPVVTSGSFESNPLRGLGNKKPKHKALENFTVLFLGKLTQLDVERARENLHPVPKASSPSYDKILKFLHKSYMGEFDFSSIRIQDAIMKNNGSVVISQSDTLIKGYLGEKWLKTDWTSIKDSDNEIYKQIKVALSKFAPKTMNSLPSLAPKRIAERDVLERWLVDGLLAAYPTLSSDLTKNDAIALILLAVFSTNFQAQENSNAVNQIFKELQKYDHENAFPFDKFNLESGKAELTKTLFQIIEKKELNFGSHVVKEILAK